ncbi:hypothetical protein HGA88_01080 [Candidatus Roizmanbacteria bacterium]|nr:hypothetical protein [Candidatus Roizmanbacteria bacterium]
MRKYYFFIASLFILVGGLVSISFLIIGSPASQRELAYDERRMANFSTIRSAISEYARVKNQLPRSLENLSLNTQYYISEDDLHDPVSKKLYEYTIAGEDSYSLCANFATNKATSTYYYTGGTQFRHTKGHSCMQVTLESYITEPWHATPTPTIRPLTTPKVSNQNALPPPSQRGN